MAAYGGVTIRRTPAESLPALLAICLNSGVIL